MTIRFLIAQNSVPVFMVCETLSLYSPRGLRRRKVQRVRTVYAPRRRPLLVAETVSRFLARLLRFLGFLLWRNYYSAPSSRTVVYFDNNSSLPLAIERNILVFCDEVSSVSGDDSVPLVSFSVFSVYGGVSCGLSVCTACTVCVSASLEYDDGVCGDGHGVPRA